MFYIIKTYILISKGEYMRKYSKSRRIVSGVLSCAVLISGCLGAVSIKTNAATTDSSFAVQMKNAGFPDSYIDSLTALHNAYPQWQFEAVDTGLDWTAVIEAESANGVNLVPKNGDDARKSTAEGAYDWFTNTWTIYDGSSWVAAHPDYIAYYMDPRNFLNETDIFQFECLSYSDSHTEEGITAILSGTFMANEVEDTDGTLLNYAGAFMEIGKETGVSPYHLASRVRQEQGLNGTSSLISGTYTGYKGYFNYFNVGAAGVTSTQVIQKGLSYAKNAGWDTRYKALLGGAQILAKNYIEVGQDTLYFQKFNVVNTKNLYRHQYMANLTAAYTEGRKLGQGYADKQQSFVFKIPVYDSMPTEAAAFTATGNPNNYLKSLTVSGQTLTPAFSGATTKYSLVADAQTKSVKITAAAAASTSTVTGTGTKQLKSGTNTFSIKCKSQRGTTKTYKITIVCKGGDEVSDVPTSSVYTVGKTQITGVEPGTTASAFLKEMKAQGATMQLIGADGKANTGNVGTGNCLELYDKNNKKISSYTIVIYGDINGDGAVDVSDMNALNQHLLEQNPLKDCYLTAANLNRQDEQINVLDLVYMSQYLKGTKTIQQ